MNSQNNSPLVNPPPSPPTLPIAVDINDKKKYKASLITAKLLKYRALNRPLKSKLQKLLNEIYCSDPVFVEFIIDTLHHARRSNQEEPTPNAQHPVQQRRQGLRSSPRPLSTRGSYRKVANSDGRQGSSGGRGQPRQVNNQNIEDLPDELIAQQAESEIE